MQTHITAHTGADGRPDNSLEFVSYALACGADALEVDVRRQAGGRLAIGHDEAGENAPLLAEVFRIVAGQPRIKINCDLKEPGLEEPVCLLAEEAGLLRSGRLILSGTVDAFRPVPGAEVYLNLEEYVPDLYLNYREKPNFELEAADIIRDVCVKAGIRTVNVYQGLVTRRFLETLAGAGIGLSVWTVNETWELKWFLKAGAANITTRRPALALELRAGREGSV
nr:glycerophosphodiester phosphodiesterase [uncultured Oscillibacter sp.]